MTTIEEFVEAFTGKPLSPLHRAVLDAVIARSPDKAERAVLKLIDSARDDIEMVLVSKKKLPSLSHPASSLRAPRGARATL